MQNSTKIIAIMSFVAVCLSTGFSEIGVRGPLKPIDANAGGNVAASKGAMTPEAIKAFFDNEIKVYDIVANKIKEDLIVLKTHMDVKAKMQIFSRIEAETKYIKENLVDLHKKYITANEQEKEIIFAEITRNIQSLRRGGDSLVGLLS
ncbi:MAG: hypothetical protein CNLJKLNK_00400 [Holosporales bacterium]